MMKTIEGGLEPRESNLITGTSCYLVIIFMLPNICFDKDNASYLFYEFNSSLKYIFIS